MVGGAVFSVCAQTILRKEQSVMVMCNWLVLSKVSSIPPPPSSKYLSLPCHHTHLSSVGSHFGFRDWVHCKCNSILDVVCVQVANLMYVYHIIQMWTFLIFQEALFIRCWWIGSTWVCLSGSVSYGVWPSCLMALSSVWTLLERCSSGTQLLGRLWRPISLQMLTCSPLLSQMWVWLLFWAVPVQPGRRVDKALAVLHHKHCALALKVALEKDEFRKIYLESHIISLSSFTLLAGKYSLKDWFAERISSGTPTPLIHHIWLQRGHSVLKESIEAMFPLSTTVLLLSVLGN